MEIQITIADSVSIRRRRYVRWLVCTNAGIRDDFVVSGIESISLIGLPNNPAKRKIMSNLQT